MNYLRGTSKLGDRCGAALLAHTVVGIVGLAQFRKESFVSQSLYDKYGGFATVSRIVLQLYDYILDDDELGPFFENTDMPKLIDHQTKFVASLMGGPASFTDAHITGAHRGMKISDLHFDRLKELVDEALGDFGVEEDDAAAILAQIEIRRNALVKASSS